MSFVVRQISRTADGREIVRPRSFDGPTLTVGRGTECDVHLADLAATLHHVTITQTGPGTITVDEAAGLQFQVGARNVRHATIDAVAGGTIRIGAHQISVAAGAEGEAAGTIVLNVERVGALSEASDEVDEDRAFSLRGTAPSKRVAAWTLAILVLLAFLAWPILSFERRPVPPPAAANTAVQAAAFHPDEMWSSGPLSAAHANLQNNCKACHQQPFVAVRDDSCTACHTSVHNHADPRRIAVAKAPPSTFGRFQLAVARQFNIPQGRCTECHTEHEGAQRMPVTQQKFCTDCHASLDQRLSDTKIENAGDFGTSHAQFKPSVLISWDGGQPLFRRVSLDQVPQEDSGLKFPHRLHLSATNSVARMAQTLGGEYGFGTGLKCKDCHVAGADGVSFRPVEMEAQCSMCHSLAFDRTDGVVRTLRHGRPREVVAELRDFYAVNGPVRPDSLSGMSRRRPGDFAADRTAFNYANAAAHNGGRAAQAIRGVFSPGGACYDCHTVSNPGGGVNYQVHPVRLQQRYETKGWFDHAAHRTETCESCHAAPASNKSSDVLLPKIASCRACHGGESARKEVPSACAMCHDYHVGDGAPQMLRNGSLRRGTPAHGRRRDDEVAMAR